MVHKRDAKDWAREHMRGLWTSPTIPFKDDFSLDEDGIRKNVDWMVDTKVDGVGFGFTEPWVCSLEERKRAMEVAVDAVGGRCHSYLHSTDHSVVETINLARHAAAVGAEAVMIWTPYEWAKSQEMIGDFFEYVGSQVDIAIFAYNTFHSGLSMAPETVARIAKVPNVCAVKDAVNDVNHTLRCIELCGDDAIIAEPLEVHLLTMTLHFGQQLLLGTTPVFLMQSPHYQPIREYFELARAGKAAEASAKYYELQPLRDIWNGMYQSLWNKTAAEHPLAYIKYWMDLNGMAGGRLRPPMKELTEDQKTEFRQRLEATGWMERLFPDYQSSRQVA